MQAGVKRGVRIGVVFSNLFRVSSIHVTVAWADASALVSCRMGEPFLSMFTLPIIVFRPVLSISSIRSSVAGTWRVPKMHALVLGLFFISSAKIE